MFCSAQCNFPKLPPWCSSASSVACQVEWEWTTGFPLPTSLTWRWRPFCCLFCAFPVHFLYVSCTFPVHPLMVKGCGCVFNVKAGAVVPSSCRCDTHLSCVTSDGAAGEAIHSCLIPAPGYTDRLGLGGSHAVHHVLSLGHSRESQAVTTCVPVPGSLLQMCLPEKHTEGFWQVRHGLCTPRLHRVGDLVCGGAVFFPVMLSCSRKPLRTGQPGGLSRVAARMTMCFISTYFFWKQRIF